MEKQYSVQFFTNFVENLQRLCQDYITYDQMVEVSGYISVEIDNSKKERYVLSELLQSTGNVISESYCTKVFKNCPLPIQRSPSQRREPPIMSQISPAGKRPLSQTSPRMNRLGQSPQMSQGGVLRQNNDGNRPSSFNQRLNQNSSLGVGRGTPPRMNTSYSGVPGPGRGMSPGQRYGQQGVGRPSLAGNNPRMMNPQQRMGQQPGQPRPPGMMQRGGPVVGPRMGGSQGSNSIQARRTFGPGQRGPPPKAASPEDDPDELEVISFVPPTRRSIGETSVSSLSSPSTPDTNSSTNSRPSFPQTSNRSGNSISTSQPSQSQSSSQSMVLPVSVVQNIAQPIVPQPSRNQQTSQPQEFQRNSMQKSSQSQSMSHLQSSDSRQPLGGQQHNFQNSQSSNSSNAQAQPSRQQIVQQMLQARASRNLTIPQSIQQPAAPTPSAPHTAQSQSQPMTSQHSSQQPQQKPPEPIPHQIYQNQNFNQPPHTPPGQVMASPLQDSSRNIWSDISTSSFPPGPSKGDQELLNSLNLPGMGTATAAPVSNPVEISARNTSFMDTAKVPPPTPQPAVPSQAGFPPDSVGTLQISNVVSIPQDLPPVLKKEMGSTALPTPATMETMNSTTPPSLDAGFAPLDPSTDVTDPTSLSFDTKLDDDIPTKKMRMSTDSGDDSGAKGLLSMIPIGRKLKEFAAKKKAKRGRPPKGDRPPKADGAGSDDDGDYEYDASVDPPNRNLRSREGIIQRRIYNESSGSESDLPEFGLNFESTSAGLVLASEGTGGETEDSGKESGGGAGVNTTPAAGDPGAGKAADDILADADNESYVLIELESDDDEGSSGAFGDGPAIVKQELSTFTKPVQFAINRLTQFMILKKVKESVYTIVPDTLDPLLAEFYLRLRKSNGQEFLANSLKQIQTCIGTYLSTNGYPYNIKTDIKFEKSKKVMENKLRHLRSREDAIFTLRSEDVDKLYEIEQLGSSSSDSMINSLWLLNTIHFSVRRPKDHIQLKWGDVRLCTKQNNIECLQHVPSGKVVYMNTDNPQRCFVSLFKKYRLMRPASAQNASTTFYLAPDKVKGFKHQKYGDYNMANIFKRMLSAAGLPPEMKISNLDIL